MPDYDIVTAIARVEDEMIDSMIRNLSRHHLEEIVEKMNWEQWQVVMLAELEKYKKRNAKKYGTVFDNINSRIESLIRKANENGQSEQEKKILEAIKKGFKGYRDPNKGLTAQFFHVNDRKMEALINATINDMKKAETAILRMANDQFRRIIFDAQVYAATGAATYKKAVDMATKDMLAAGLNCVEYKNGARHRLDDYAEMAIRTASKRAYLSGEGVMRQKWGISLVIINKRQAACPKCAPFVGKIMIDDVWSGGSREDGEYPLMSEAVAAGLYHPRCKDAHSTYFKGISRGPGNGYTQEELEDLQEQSSQEARQQYAERQVEKYERLEKYSLDKENQSLYNAKLDALDREQIMNDEDTEYIRNNLPKRYQDRRNVGELITENDLNDFINYASKIGIQIGVDGNETGGFETYRGDVSVLYEMVDAVNKQLKCCLFRNSNVDNIILMYDNVLGFDGDNSKIDIDAFASTKGRTITLNKFMFDDSEYLKNEYSKSSEEGYFVKGTNYRNIIAHEVGHIIDKNSRGLRAKIQNILENEARKNGISFNDYLVNNISMYSAECNSKGYHELVSEVNSLLNYNKNSDIIQLLRKEGVIYEVR